MKNWTIAKRITFGFASVIVVALALGLFAYTRLIDISGHSDKIAKLSLPAIELVGQAQSDAKEQVQLVYKHIGSTDKDDMAHLEASMDADAADSAKVYDELDKLITDGNGRALLDKIEAARTESSRIQAQLLDLSKQVSSAAQGTNSAQSTNSAQVYNFARTQFDPANVQYLAALDGLIEFVKADADGASKSIQTAVQSSKAGISIGLTVATIVGIGVAFLIIRGTSHILHVVSTSLDDGASQVASAASEVSTSSQTLAEGSSEQAASIEETSSSLEELSSMTRRNAENSQKANELSKQTRTAAEKGVNDMHEMNTAMGAIKASSDDIAKIIRTIDEIAFQTNILALNAAVEAARAGEAGMGFAVVADEVRNLAQRSAQAAKETSAKIEGAIAKTTQGVELSEKVSQALNDIVVKARQVDELAAEVAVASREQTQGITQINVAVGQMDKVTQSNAASAEESAAAAEELNAQAVAMKQVVGELLNLVGGATSPARPASLGEKPVKTKSAAAPSHSHNGNGNGHAPAPEPAMEMSNRRNEIPMDGDFKDF